MIATTDAMNRPYPARKVVNTEADARIFHGQIAKPSSSTRNWPRGMVRYLGKSSVESEPKGIMFAATFVPRMLRDQPKATRRQAKRVEGDQ
jgi:hypothetical protein